MDLINIKIDVLDYKVNMKMVRMEIDSVKFMGA
jgi:hypothetical protein